jgi:short-subunit dehydrogenase
MADKIAIITGASSGIGAAFATHFAKEGYDLFLTGHPDDNIMIDHEDLIRKYHVKIEMILADLANEDDIAKVEEIIEKNTGIEVLINNAGFGFWKPFWENDIHDIEDMIKVHINVPLRFIYAALPAMTSKRKGIIINLSSLSSFFSVPGGSVYSATKLFHNCFMESLHISVRDKGIKVQVLCPGFVNTNFHKRAGLNTFELKKNKIVTWMSPERVVGISIRNLKKKNKVIVVPGFMNKLIRFIITNAPRPVYYSLAAKYLR